MRLGLIGLGRIGAFHTNTLVGIPAIDSLVVTDILPAKTKHIVDRFAGQGVEFGMFLDVAGRRPSPCTIADGLEADWIAEACARSQKEHRPVRIEEVRIT